MGFTTSAVKQMMEGTLENGPGTLQLALPAKFARGAAVQHNGTV